MKAKLTKGRRPKLEAYGYARLRHLPLGRLPLALTNCDGAVVAILVPGDAGRGFRLDLQTASVVDVEVNGIPQEELFRDWDAAFVESVKVIAPEDGLDRAGRL